jgi:hypothetical protein
MSHQIVRWHGAEFSDRRHDLWMRAAEIQELPLGHAGGGLAVPLRDQDRSDGYAASACSGGSGSLKRSAAFAIRTHV